MNLIKYRISETRRGSTDNALPFFIKLIQSNGDGSAYVKYITRNGVGAKNPHGFKSYEDAENYVKENVNLNEPLILFTDE